ncbi:hypothetical protein [Methylobacterium nigriterrae]|uniref:hypothetical protein n=1 Tax=Methylobacterium nigriterrae TaxID=3127512 RepID=UPI0030138DDD
MTAVTLADRLLAGESLAMTSGAAPKKAARKGASALPERGETVSSAGLWNIHDRLSDRGFPDTRPSIAPLAAKRRATSIVGVSALLPHMLAMARR